MLFDKCEVATVDIDKVMSTTEFNGEMDAFARDMQRNLKTSSLDHAAVVTENKELDSLVRELQIWLHVIT